MNLHPLRISQLDIHILKNPVSLNFLSISSDFDVMIFDAVFICLSPAFSPLNGSTARVGAGIFGCLKESFFVTVLKVGVTTVSSSTSPFDRDMEEEVPSSSKLPSLSHLLRD